LSVSAMSFGVQHFSPPEARHARNAIEILDAFAGVFQNR